MRAEIRPARQPSVAVPLSLVDSFLAAAPSPPPSPRPTYLDDADGSQEPEAAREGFFAHKNPASTSMVVAATTHP